MSDSFTLWHFTDLFAFNMEIKIEMCETMFLKKYEYDASLL